MRYEFTFKFFPRDEAGRLNRDRYDRVTEVYSYPTLADALQCASVRELDIGCEKSGGPADCQVESFRWIEEMPPFGTMSDGELLARTLIATNLSAPFRLNDADIDWMRKNGAVVRSELERREAARKEMPK